MSKLFSTSAIRLPKALSPKRIAQAGKQTHLPNSQSEQYRKWVSLLKAEKMEAVQASMKAFLSGKSALRQWEQFPETLQGILQFADQEGYDFSVQMLWEKVNECEKKNRIREEARKVQVTLEDQLLAEVIQPSGYREEFDLPKVLHTLDLIQQLEEGEGGRPLLVVGKIMAIPHVLPQVWFPLRPCLRRGEQQPGGLQERIENLPNESSRSLDDDCGCNPNQGDDPCNCECSETCVPQNLCCAPITPYIAEVFEVRDEPTCYEEGEIVYIENVIASETRTREYREKIIVKETNEVETNENTFEERNHKVEDKSSIHREITNVLETKISSELKGSLSGKIPLIGDLGVSSQFNSSLDVKTTRKLVRDQSRNVISDAVSRLERKVRTKSVRSLTRESEETSTHTLGPIQADTSRNYHAVNLYRKAEVLSHGPSMVLDINLAEPAELFKALLEKEFGVEKPKRPCISVEEIDPNDYDEYVRCYGFAGLEPPRETPPDFYDTFEIYREKPKGEGKVWDALLPITVPTGYRAVEISIVNNVMHPVSTVLYRYVRVDFGGASLIDTNGHQGAADDYGPKVINVTQSGNAQITMHWVNDFKLVVRVKYEAIPVDNTEWKLEVHRRIMERYAQELAEYEAAREAYEAEKNRIYNGNPERLQEIIQEQIKHAAITYITCQFFEGNNAMRSKVEGCGYPQMDLPETYREGLMVRFIEQAFDWSFLNYVLYQWSWARKCSWADKLGEQSTSPLFQKFLRSGFARVVIRVREGFESNVAYYLTTGQIWGSSGVPPIIGPTYVNIITELREARKNFHADRDGNVTHDTTAGLQPNQVILQGNTDYYAFPTPSTPVFDPLLASEDINREVYIDCKRYKIIAIVEDPGTGNIIITLDRDFAETVDKSYPWSTGALCIGSPWEYKIATDLVRLSKNSECLPCLPVKCPD